MLLRGPRRRPGWLWLGPRVPERVSALRPEWPGPAQAEQSPRGNNRKVRAGKQGRGASQNDCGCAFPGPTGTRGSGMKGRCPHAGWGQRPTRDLHQRRLIFSQMLGVNPSPLVRPPQREAEASAGACPAHNYGHSPLPVGEQGGRLGGDRNPRGLHTQNKCHTKPNRFLGWGQGVPCLGCRGLAPAAGGFWGF